MAISPHSPFSKRASTSAAVDNDHPPSTGAKMIKNRLSMSAKRSSRPIQASTMPPSKTSTDTLTSSSSGDNTVEFAGDLTTNNEIPTQEVLKKIENMTLLDRDGRTIPFKSLYSGPNVAPRVLIIFIRHFFCGNCQEYLRTLATSITPDSLLHLPTPTFIAVVGHGSPSLISMYQSETQCPFPIYADPTKRLYSELGMLRTLNLGARPEYQRRSIAKGMFHSVRQGLFNLKGGKAFQGGDLHQVGGEFLFEPVNIHTPITSPADEADKQLGANGDSEGNAGEKRITWCHRMRNTRDHAELPELREVLGLDGEGVPGKDRKRWTKALGERKGTGLSTRTSSSTNRNEGGSERQSMEKGMVEKIPAGEVESASKAGSL